MDKKVSVITVPKGVKAQLSREFGCHPSTVDKALLGDVLSQKKMDIRKRALQLGGTEND